MKKLNMLLGSSFIIITFSLKVKGNDYILTDITHPIKQLAEVVVAADRFGLKIEEIPFQTKSINTEQLIRLNPQTSALALQNSGALTVQMSQQGGGSPVIRGFESSRILLVVDNVRLNNLIFRSGHLQNIIGVSPFSLEQIDILYGPSSVMYGSDALGGTIHLMTRQPNLAFSNHKTNVSGEATLRFNSANNETNEGAYVNIGTEKWASLTMVNHNRYGDLRSGNHKNPFLHNDEYINREYIVFRKDGEDITIKNGIQSKQPNSGYQQYDLMQKVLYQPSSNIQHLLNIQFSNTNDVPRYDRLTELTKGKPKYAEWYYGPQMRWLNSYQLNLLDLLGADRVRFITSYQQLRESRHNRRLNNIDRRSQEETVDAINLSFDWLKKGKHTIHTGIDGVLNFLESTAYMTNVDTEERSFADTRYPKGSTMHNFDAFFTHSIVLDNSLWTLTDGIRLGYSRTKADFSQSPYFQLKNPHYTQNNFTYSANLGMNWLIPNKHRFSWNISTGFRIPNIDDLGKVFDSSPGRLIIPNTNVSPEKNVQLELNYTLLGGDLIEWETSIYGTYLFDALSLKKTTYNGVDSVMYDGTKSEIYAIANTNRAYVLGSSSTIRIYPHTQWLLSASSNFTYGRYLEDGKTNPMDHISPLFGKVSVTYFTPSKKFSAEIYSLFNGKKRFRDYNLVGEDNIAYATVKGAEGDGLPAWFTLNLSASYELKYNIRLLAGLENILDTQYRTFGSGINASGRSCYISLRYHL